MILIDHHRFVDEHHRTLVLRGVNLGGNSKVPRHGESFVGRPFELAEADAHFARLHRWGLRTLRLLTTWEAVEHAGPRQYDLAYLDFFEALVKRAGEHGLQVFVDFHQDVWSRFCGGSGAPGWTLHAAGFELANLHQTGAAFLASEHVGPLPRMIWPTNAGKLASATMFTLFFGGDAFAPGFCIEGNDSQRWLQEHFFGAVEQVVRRIGQLPHVFGIDLLNEPSPGYIGWKDLERPGAPVEVGAMPSPLQSMALGMGHSQKVNVYRRGLLGVRVTGTQVLNPGKLKSWRGGRTCPWQQHGVWSEDPVPHVQRPNHFSYLNGQAVSFTEHFYKPFLQAGAARVHGLAPKLAVMLEGVPFEPGPTWDVSQGGPVAYAPHWYDGFVLFLKDYRSFLAADAFSKKPVFGAARIRQSFQRQLRRLLDEAAERTMPAIIGELGIAFDLRRGKAYRSGDYSLQRAAMDRTLTAVEDAMANATLWNYSADNTHADGDGWNGEDLSIYCADTARPGDDDSGGRALEAVVRPRPLAVAGTPVRYGFELSSRRFELAFTADQRCTAPTEIFVPALHYPRGVALEVSDGETTLDAAGQVLTWRHDPAYSGLHRLIITPAR